MGHPRDEQGSGNVLSGMRANAIEQRERASVKREKAKQLAQQPINKVAPIDRILQEQQEAAPLQPTRDPTELFTPGLRDSPLPFGFNPNQPPLAADEFPFPFIDKEDRQGLQAPADLSRRDVAQQAKILTQKKRELEKEVDNLTERELNPVDALAASQLREAVEVELAKVEVDLLELQNSLGIEDTLFQLSAEHAGLADALDLDPLKDALGTEGGLGAQTFKAILDIADNVALSQQEQDDAIDLVLTRRNISDELIAAVNDMVDTKNDLEELNEMTNRELLDNAAEFIAPPLAFDVQGENDADRCLADMFNAIAPFLEINVPATIPTGHPSEQLYNEVILQAMQSGIDRPDVTSGIEQLAAIWDLDAGELTTQIKNARLKASANKTAWDEALEADEAAPGSGNLIAALWQAGEAIGWNPEQLEMAAKSRDLHALIDVKSKGVSGIQREGNIAGIGGLTLEMYKTVMGEEWNEGRGMAWELEALLSYIDQFFNGDALAAVRFYREAEEWGGSGTLSGGGSDIVANVGT